MAEYSYRGRNKDGESVEGILEGQSEGNIADILINDGITPIEIELFKQTDIIAQAKDILRFNFGKPTITDLILFSRQMYSLMRAGVSIVKAIKVVADSVKNERLNFALQDTIKKLEGGQAMATCMRRHADIFPRLMISLISIGENTGNLDEVFEQISVHLERENETKRKIKSAMRYPIVVLVTIVIAVGVINLLVVPAFANFFGKFGSELPLPTKILITTSNFTVNYWYLVALSFMAAIISWIMFLRTDKGILWWDQWKLKIPLVGSIIERALLARFARSFALTSRTGVPLLEAINVISKTTENTFIAGRIGGMRESIERGESLMQAAMMSEMFPPLVLQMISVGEETGEVDRLLEEVANFYEDELDYDLKTLSQAIEPILIGIVAVMVLILALGVFLPMWDIAQVALG